MSCADLGIGFLPQCWRNRLRGSEFCGKHNKGPSSLPHGRYDNPVDPVVTANSEKHVSRERRKIPERWYSRILMLERAMEWQLESVDAMSDAQFDEALNHVHATLLWFPTLRNKFVLESNQGPANASERTTETSILRLASPTLHLLFISSVLQELKTLDAQARPLHCSDSLFFTAMKQTDLRMKNFTLVRNLESSCLLRGPQHPAQRDAAHLYYEPDSEQQRLRLARNADNSFPVLQCGACEKW